MDNFKIKKLPQSEMEINFSVTWDNWKNFIGKAVEDFSKEMKIKGFRPGKAPRNVVEQKVGAKAILEAAAEKVMQREYGNFLDQEKIEAIGSPRAEILKLAEGNELEFKIITAVIPEVDLGDWKKAAQKVNAKHKKEEISITEEEIQKELQKIAESRAKLITVSREARKGDAVFVDFDTLHEGMPIENGKSANHPLLLGSGVFIPGFEDNLVGMKEKEEKSFELSFPEKYHDEKISGKKATFKVKMNLVQERQIPEVNDEFAQSLGDFKNIEKLKNNLQEGMKMEKERESKGKWEGELVEALTQEAKAEIPEVLIHAEIHKMVDEFAAQIGRMGMSWEDYLAKVKKTPQELEKEWEPQAEKKVKAALILEKLAKEVEIQVSSEEVEKEMNKTIQYYKKTKDAEKNIDLKRLYNYVQGLLVNEKVFEYLEGLY